MGLDFTWLGLEKSNPPSPGDLEKPDPNANPGSLFLRVQFTIFGHWFSLLTWRWTGDKPLSEPMMFSLLTHTCVTWSQWVKWLDYCFVFYLIWDPNWIHLRNIKGCDTMGIESVLWILMALCFTLRPRQNGRHFRDDILKWISLSVYCIMVTLFSEQYFDTMRCVITQWIAIRISLNFVPRQGSSWP